jgi:hypothetical protein
MAQKGRKKKEEARLKQEQSRQVKEQRALDAWQEIVDEAHAEAILEDNIRTVDDIINKAYSSNEELLNDISYKTDDTFIKESRYNTELELKAQQEKFYADNIDVDVRAMDAMHEEALKINQKFDADKVIKQKEEARNSRINGIIDDAFGHSSSGEAHAYLNKLNRNGVFDNQEDFLTAKARLTEKYNNKTTRSVLNRPNTAEGVNRLKGKSLKFHTTKNAYGISSKANGEIVGTVYDTTSRTVAEGAEDVGNQYLKKALSGRNLNALMNLGFAVSDYNESRNSGDGVLKAGAKAGTLFVAGEMLGGWMMPVMLAKQLPTLAVSGIEATQNITRKMNSTARIQTFGEAQFQDTQQLATMRQAGMELAKMSQYNLQQSIMGNEAQYMHRL